MVKVQWWLTFVLCAAASVAHAHISVDDGGTHMSRQPDTDLKTAPCGSAGSTRGSNVYTYKPGETINISIVETIPHPGYFRIAFDDDGDDDFEIPSGTDGADGDCAGDPACGMGKEDYCNNATVLLDHLDQHSSASSKGTYTWSVTLPNIECDNCTLQIIQVMNDLNFHFAPYPTDDIYYHCIDLVLSNSADDVNDTPVTNDGMVCPAAPGTGGMGGAGGSGGAGGGGMGGEGGVGGMGGAGGGGASSGSGAGMGGMGAPVGAGGASGSGGMGTAGTIAGPGGAGSGAPVVPVGGAGGALSMPTTGAGKEESGCRAAAGDGGGPNLAALAIALLALGARRRRGARPLAR